MAAWFALIGLSALTTYQHHVIDVPAGWATGWACVRWIPNSNAARSASLRGT